MYKNIEDRRAKARELYSKNPETYSKRNKEKRENRKNQLYELFGNKCSKCGCKNLLEIDHINPGLKKNRISPLSQGISKTICDLVQTTGSLSRARFCQDIPRNACTDRRCVAKIQRHRLLTDYSRSCIIATCLKNSLNIGVGTV